MSVKHWFLPQNPDLLGMLRDQAAVTADAMADLVAWGNGDPAAAERVRDCEHRADEAKRSLWKALQESFAPPLDAEDLFTLSADLDEVLNGMKDLVREMEVMQMAPDEPTAEMVDLLAGAVEQLCAAFGALEAHGDEPTAHADAAIKAQRRVEHVYRAAMSRLLDEADLREVIGRREAYRRLSRIGDDVHRVAERIWYARVKEA